MNKFDEMPKPVSGNRPFRCHGKRCDALLQSCCMFKYTVRCPKCGHDNGELKLIAGGVLAPTPQLTFTISLGDIGLGNVGVPTKVPSLLWRNE